MSFMQLNGITIPIRTCEMGHAPISSSVGYSPNGYYQLARNGFGRVWKCRTGFLTGDMRLALMEILGHRGDHWRFDVASANRPLSTTASDFYSDMRRPAYNASGLGNAPVATVQSAFAADGGLVYDKNGVADRPWEGATGAVLCETSSSNRLSANQAHPTLAAHVTAIGTPATVAPTTARRWYGSTCIGVTMKGAAGDGIEFDNMTVAAADYAATNFVVFSFYARGLAGGEEIRVTFLEDTGGGYASIGDAATFEMPSDADGWIRCQYVLETDGASVGVRPQILNSAGSPHSSTIYIDGCQFEVQNTIKNPTSWLAGYAAGPTYNTRAAGDLQYDNVFSSMTKGFTVSCWVKHMRLGLASPIHYVWEVGTSGSTGSRAYFRFAANDTPVFICLNDSGGANSQIGASGAALADSDWHHWACVYDPSAPKTYLYKDSVLAASDTTYSGAREFDPSLLSGDLHIGNISSGTTAWGPGPITHMSILPFAAPAEVITGLYNSGSGCGGGSPGVLPIVVSGTALGIGEGYVSVIASMDSAPHVPWWNGSTFEGTGGEIAFTLMEAVRR